MDENKRVSFTFEELFDSSMYIEIDKNEEPIAPHDKIVTPKKIEIKDKENKRARR